MRSRGKFRPARCVLCGTDRNIERNHLGGRNHVVWVIEQRSRFKREKKDAVANFLKVLGNSGSYGLFVQVDPETKTKPVNLKVYSGEAILRLDSAYVEKSGPWYFPPLASLITAGGRLLLAMLEKCVRNAGGSYLFCDTDSLCVVASKTGGLIPCVGGSFRLHGKEAIKALSIRQVEAIAKRFNTLNPYNPSLVKNLLKIEDINFSESDSKDIRPCLWGYAIAAKRYALYKKTGNGISIVKASGHGLGYLKRDWANVQTTLDSEVAIDCVVNRTLIPKLTNIKVSNKAPSKYLSEIKAKNPNIVKALESHMLNGELLSSDYDKNYDYFISERSDAILTAIRTNITEARVELLKQYGVSTNIP